MSQLPILEIVKHSLTQPMKKPVELLKAFGLLLLSGVLAGIAGFIAGLLGLIDADAMAAMDARLSAGDWSALMTILPLMLIVFFFVMIAVSYIFNYWVRVGAFGFEAERQGFGSALGSATINGIKFLLITILLGLISFVVVSALNALGLAPGLGEQMQASASGELAQTTREGLLPQVITTLISAAIYSFFSANLTQTAIGSDKEGLQHPFAMDFGIVLVLLYAIVLVPTTIAGLIGNMALAQALNLMLGFYIMFSLAIAHGIRYRFCVSMEERGHDGE